MNTELLKKPQTWAVIIPTLTILFALYSVFQCLSRKKDAAELNGHTNNALIAADNILALHKQFGSSPLTGVAARNFTGVDSALACSQNAKIPSGRLSRLASTNSENQRDGSILHGENYQLDRVNLLQVIQFIDYAERSYASLSCTNLTLEVPSRGALSTDNWSAQLNLKYLEK